MHRNRTWLLDPIELRTQRNRILPIEGGDGSTLSLDFTTGVLDPRLTFTRGSNATFINSNGLVQYAASNQLSNSVFAGAGGATGPTGWLVSFIGGTGNFSLSGTELTISNNGIADRSRIYQTGPTGNGLFVTVQMKIVANNTGGLSLAEIVAFSINGQSSVTYRVNGVTQTSSYTGWTAGDLVTLTCIPTVGSAATCLFGVGCSNNVAKSASVTIKDVQIEVGTTANTYNPTTTSGAYYAPRFDYDPTSIGTPRGLLIEGSATNLCEQGQYCWGAGTTFGWGRSANIHINSVNGTSGANAVPRIDGPDGGSLTGTSIFKDSGSTFVRLNQDVAVVQNTTYTFSAYVRAPSGGNPYIRLAAFNGGTWLNTTGGCTLSTVTITNVSGAGSRFNGVPSGSWVRVWVTFTTQAAQTTATIAFYPDVDTSNAATMYVWGSQVETGSGPSSVVLTGASQGSRAADKMSMTDISTMQWNQTAGTFALHMDVAAETNTSSFPAFMGMYTATPVRVFRFLLNNSSGTNPRIGNDTWTAAPTQILSNLVTRSTAPTAFKFAVSSSNTGQTVNQVVNAGSVTTTSGTGTLQTPTRLLWQQDPSALDTEYFPIHIRSLKYWPTALPTAQLQSITT